MSFGSRRQFLKFMGRTVAVAGTLPWLVDCVHKPGANLFAPLPFRPLKPTGTDDLVLAEGFRYDILLRWRQPLNNQGARFGYNNDYIAYLPLTKDNPNEGLMWVNHEYHDPYFVSDWRPGQPRTREQVDIERREVGGSIVHVKWDEGRWSLVADSKYNRRLDAFTPIPLISERPILGRTTAMGTFANCAGGVTPWGTVLSCEENYDNFVGEVAYEKDKRRLVDGDPYLSWMKFVKLPPEHYGWVVEIDVRTGKAKKQCALGRFAHECATTVTAADGRAVVYSGDDTDNEHIYKFISRTPGSLEQGQLYVAQIETGRWLPLNRRLDDRLKKAFKDHTEMLIRTREAAKIVGATPMDRPEDIEIDPRTGHVFVALTNNKSRGNHFGSILKIMEKDNDPSGLEFTSATFLTGGSTTGFACPDNMAFDRQGNLWFTNDMSGSAMKSEPYTEFGNNGLFFVSLRGRHAGRVLQVASAPNGAEFTGPCFSPDGRTLFLSVQHPGERGHARPQMVSHWPDGGDSLAAPCVVALSGPALDSIVAGT